jgi:branched-chain amino acid aminotransferase
MAILGARVWFDGVMRDATNTSVPLADRGFTLGDGLFETMLWTGTQVRFFDDHMARLSSSALQLGFWLPFGAQEIKVAVTELAQDAGGLPAAVRLTLTRGMAPRGLALPSVTMPLLLATIAPMGSPTGRVVVKSVAITRHAGAPSAQFKTLSYVDNIMALSQATTLGGNEALLLGTSGNVACASGANLIFRCGGVILTPALQDGALPGIVRGRLLAAGLIEEAHIAPFKISACDRAALTNALIGVRGISMIDDHVLSNDPDWLQPMVEVLMHG